MDDSPRDRIPVEPGETVHVDVADRRIGSARVVESGDTSVVVEWIGEPIVALEPGVPALSLGRAVPMGFWTVPVELIAVVPNGLRLVQRPKEAPKQIQRREYHRVWVTVPFRYRFERAKRWRESETWNLSAGGLLGPVEFPERFHRDLTVEVDLPGETEPYVGPAQLVRTMDRPFAESWRAGVATLAALEFRIADERVRTRIARSVFHAQAIARRTGT